MTDLAALLERITEARGADRRLDAALARYFDLPECHAPDCLPDVFDRNLTRVENGGDDSEVPLYTSSVDASLGLVEKVLPGWQWYVSNVGSGDYCSASLMMKGTGVNRVDETGATAPLAILSALLRAKLSEAG